MTRRLALAIVCAFAALSNTYLGAHGASEITVRAVTDRDLRTRDSEITGLARSGQLRVRSTDRDPFVSGRLVERFDQYHRGVRVFGGDVVRDSDRGVAHAVLGRLAQNIELSVEPALSMEAGRSALLRVAGEKAFLLSDPELVILPHGGDYRLAYMGVVSPRGDVLRAFVDAHTGAELLRFTEIQRQAAVGKGRGVLGDEKKMSVARQGGVYVASDQLRPPVLVTYDLRGDLSRVISVVEQDAPLFASDLAMDTDNDWTDVAAVDAHAHIGWTYDYDFKRFGRRGLDERDRPIVTVINGVSQQGALSLSLDQFD